MNLLVRPLKKVVRRRTAGLNSAAPPQLRMIAMLQDLPLQCPVLAAGYTELPYSSQLNERWRSLLDRSDEFGSLDRKTFKREVISDLVPNSVVLIEHHGELVGCASARTASRFPSSAILSYVYVTPSHRGKGLGAYVTARAMEAAQGAGHASIILHTDDHRLTAIRTYIGMGFAPVEAASADAGRRWEAVLEGMR